MKLTKFLVSIIVIRLIMPGGPDKMFKNVKRFILLDSGTVYCVELDNNHVLYLPSAFTIIEERK